MNDGGALANIGGVVSITNSCIVDNSLPSVYNETGSPQIDAVNNWWGTNQPGSNSLVSGDVTFMPVSTQDNCGKAIGVPDEFVTVFVPPYELCRNTSSSSDVTLPIEFENFIQGFNYTESNCSFNEGTLSHRIMVWGGSEGNILRPAGSREAFASNFIEVEYIPSVTGMIEIEANVVVNANVAAAAGSASIFPDVNDALSIVADLPTMLGNFITVAEGLTTASFGGIKSEAYMTVDVGDSVNETVQTIGGHGFVSSFPIPPYTQSESFTSERIILLITSPATQGEPIYIRVGVRTEAKATGWAGAHWNLRGQDSIIESINIRPQG